MIQPVFVACGCAIFVTRWTQADSGEGGISTNDLYVPSFSTASAFEFCSFQ